MADPSYTAAKPGEFFCPTGGKWYACETGTKFVGCCTADPCTNGCHGDILRPAGRSTALNNISPGGSCGGQTEFWTCELAPTFWGCCNADPCMNNSTCPIGKLEPAFWDRPDQYEYFKDLNIALSSTAPRATASPSPTASAVPSSHPNVSGAVIGGAVGGALALVVIILAIVYFLCYRKRRNRKQNINETEESRGSITRDKQPSVGMSSGLSPPPTYSWDTAGNQQWTHYQPPLQELAEERAKGSPYAELHAKSSPLSELGGDTAASELESPEITQTEFTSDRAKHPQALGFIMEENPERGERR